MAGAVASGGARMGFVAASDATGEVLGTGVQIGFWALTVVAVCGMLWLSARLWLALYRLVDPSRTRVTAVECLRWSWRCTGGATQWRVLAFILLVGALAGALMVPGEWMGTHQSATVRVAGLLVSAALAALVWLPLTLAASGALYERFAPPPAPAA
ncbi:MAG: hypothetical protein JNK53_03455 [Phycisphaerae bacterium]|nr:hypothetical protein [Phycisphaerae bacterium]